MDPDPDLPRHGGRCVFRFPTSPRDLDISWRKFDTDLVFGIRAAEEDSKRTGRGIRARHCQVTHAVVDGTAEKG